VKRSYRFIRAMTFGFGGESVNEYSRNQSAEAPNYGDEQEIDTRAYERS
jgi:hypothetical protein